METKSRQKICYNCNAQVDLETIVCPYCGTDLLEEFDSEYISDEDIESKALSPQQTIASLYPPPYQTHSEEEEEEIEEEADADDEENETSEEPRQSIISISMIVLMLSASLIGLTLLLFFFSEDGKVILHVNIKYLAILFLLSLPAFLWSWQDLKEK